jgi:hypothetical protein
MTTTPYTDCTPATLAKRLLDLVGAARDEAPRIKLLEEIEGSLHGVQYNLHRLQPGLRDSNTTDVAVLLRLGWCLGKLHAQGALLAASRHAEHRDLGARCVSVAKELIVMLEPAP